MRVLTLIVGLLVVAGLVWVGSELHYRNCIEAAKLTPEQGGARGEFERFQGKSRRAEAAKGCSRVPF